MRHIFLILFPLQPGTERVSVGMPFQERAFASIVCILLVFVLSSCIKPYEPVIESADAVKFVVSGQVNKGDSIQRITVSTTSPVSNPRKIPVAGCTVKIVDDKGNSFPAADMQDGNYEAVIPESRLAAGSSFMVDILVPDGSHLVSGFEQLYSCPEVDTVYYVLAELPANNPLIVTRGIQFYTNLNAENSDSRYFRWDITETWEFKAVYPIEWYYNGHVNHIFPPDFSRKVCWNTAMVKNVFTLATKNLVQNKYDRFPLHFVDNVSSSRLKYGFSLLFRQYSLSQTAYEYWEKLRVNSNEQGGLYEKQPLSIRGNLHNVNKPDQQVLGFFGASSVASKRIFVKDVENLPLEYNPGCSVEGEKARLSFAGISALAYPVYLYSTPYGYAIILLEPHCYDCRLGGGDTIKPAFWPY
jgi:hypothetical protein